MREAAEELGVTVDALHLVPLCSMHRTHGNHDPADERADFFFTCHQWSGLPRVMEAGKNARLGWFPLDSLPDPVVPHERFVLDRLATGRLPPVVTYGF